MDEVALCQFSSPRRCGYFRPAEGHHHEQSIRIQRNPETRQRALYENRPPTDPGAGRGYLRTAESIRKSEIEIEFT